MQEDLEGQEKRDFGIWRVSAFPSWFSFINLCHLFCVFGFLSEQGLQSRQGFVYKSTMVGFEISGMKACGLCFCLPLLKFIFRLLKYGRRVLSCGKYRSVSSFPY